MKPEAEQSRNSWINKDEPTEVSTMAPYKDGFEDILEERRRKSDLLYCTRTRKDVPSYKYNKHRTPNEIKEHVFKSQRVTYAIEKISRETGESVQELRKEAQSLLDEMAHSLSMGGIRSLAYAIILVLKSLYNRIYVNEEGVQMLRKMIHEYPVIVMPTHRSYMDFLLVSYIFYEYDLPLPTIAAAMDFKGMKFMGWLLRKCGAFYIRRGIGSDELYWAVLTEYMQTQLRNGDNPIEFFVEATRSRTAKSYTPRIGMLSAALESYFKAEVPDVMILPFSISYDKILEESLYAYELLGIPKPKESTAGLFKARSILSEDFGNIHCFIGEPISVRQFTQGKINRGVHALEPRYINNLTPEENEVSRTLAYRVIEKQLSRMVVSPWALMAAVLMQSLEGITIKQLLKETDWLKRQGVNMGAYVDWPGNASPEAVVRHYLVMHTNVVSVSENDLVELSMIRAGHVKNPNEVMVNAATNLVLASYRNQLLHVFVRPAIVALTVNGCPNDTMSIEELYSRYQFLEKMFSKDFIFQPGQTENDFQLAVLNLSHSGGLTTQDGLVLIKRSISKHTTFLSQMFEPFLLGYWVLCQHLLSLTGDKHGRPLPKKPKQIAQDAQKLGIALIQEGVVKHYEVLSLDLLSNGLAALADIRVMYKDKRNDEPWLSPNHVAVARIADEIGKYIELPSLVISNFLQKKKSLVVTAKL